MNKYEAMVIFAEELKDSELDEVLGRLRDEIKKFGGIVQSATRLGKRTFARPLQKRDGGQYVLVEMDMDGGQVTPLLAKLKLNEDVFRVQVVRAPEKKATPNNEGSTDGGS